MQPKPLLPTEVPETLISLFFFDRQFISKRGLRIWRCCRNCHQEYHSLVADVRANITRGRLATGLCAKCGHTPGLHQVGIRVKPQRRSPDGFLNGQKYRMIYQPQHPDADKNGHVREHRFIMEQMLGRPLAPGETVHHKNRKRADNQPHNLELWVGDQPSGARVRDLYQDLVREAMAAEGCDREAIDRVLIHLREAPDSVL